jgi:hypothetical protein
MKVLNLKKSVYELTEEYPELIEIFQVRDDRRRRR